MADYWKSQPRKFCQYCKCWIADNKPSVEFHERGKNHKENVAAKISEIKKKSVEKAKQEERMSKQFAAMEEAAMKAYEEDLKRIDMESKGLTYTAPPPAPPKPQPKPKPKPPKKRPDKWRARPREQTETPPVWVEGLSDEGHTYYYNTITGESRWEKPGSSHGESSRSVRYEQTEVPQSSAGCAWMEAVSPDGFPYYYNSETGESSWEKPADFPSTEASNPTAESNKGEESQQEASTPPSEPLSGGDESSSVAAVASEVAEVPEESSQQLKIPNICFKKRKVEAEPSGKEEDEAADVKSGADAAKEDEGTKKKRKEDVQSTPVEPEKTMTQTTKSATRAKRPRMANPYGVWEKIQEEEDPYMKVDLQLPQVEESTPGPAGDMPAEPKPKFRERIITSIGGGGGDGPAWFRKNKTPNGRSRSLRQRDDDDD